MNPLLKLLEFLINWWNRLFSNESALSIASFVLAIISLVVGVLAMIYANQSSKRADKLLKRLVIYPFRELDLAISNLTSLQRDELLTIHKIIGTKSFTLTDVRPLLGQFSEATINLLVEKGWIIKKGKGNSLLLNPDRRAYLAFYTEASQSMNGEK